MSDSDYGLAVTPREAADEARRARRKARRHARKLRETMAELRPAERSRPRPDAAPPEPEQLSGEELNQLLSLLIRFRPYDTPLPDDWQQHVQRVVRLVEAALRP